MSVLDGQRNGPQRSNTTPANFGNKESAANFNFLGGQQQMSSQQPGLMQSLTRQQSGITDAQMLQQQVTMKQMQEMQRQQQLQQLEAMQRNTMNQMPMFSNQGAGNHAASFINGSPMHEASNYSWPSHVMSGSPNWLQHGPSPAMQGYTNGVMMPPGHGQSVHLMGLNSQQAPPSLYGVPVSSTRPEGGFLMNQADKTGLHQVPLQGNFSDNQHPTFAEQMSMRGGSTVSRQGFEGKGFFEYASRQGSVNAMSVENFNEMKQRSLLASDGRHDNAVSRAMSISDQSTNQAASSHAPVGLDPTEEKILFGDDDNIWDAFGESLSGSTTAVNNLDGAFPSMQSGSWSALMQSAVAESVNDAVVQTEWRGVGVQNSGSLTGKPQPPKFLNSGEQPAGWFDQSSMAPMNSRPSSDPSLGSAYHNSGLQKSLTNQGREGLPSRPSQKNSEEGKKWSDRSQPKTIAERSQSHESDYGFGDFSSKSPVTPWSHQQRTSSMENRPGGLNFIQSVSNHGLMSRDQEKLSSSDGDRGMNLNIGDGGCKSILSVGRDSNIEGRHHINSKDDIRISDNNHQQEFWRSVSSDTKSEVDGVGMYQQHMNKGMQRVLHSSTNSYDHGRAEIPETGSSDKRENSSDSYSSNLSNRASTGRMRENVWLDAGDTHGMSGGKQNSSGQGDVRVSYGISPSQIHPGYVSATPTSFDRSGGISTSNTPISTSQNMLELLHKVDQSKDQTTPANLNSGDRSRQSSGANETEASGRNAAFSPSYSFSSQGFGLQLAPPSQGLPASNFVVPSQNMSHTVNSPSPSYVVSDKGDKSHAWLTQAGSGQSISSVHDAQQGGAQANRSDVPWHIRESLARNMQGNFPASFPSQSQHLKSLLHNQQMANAALKANHPGNASFDWQASHDKQMTSAVAQRVNTPTTSTDPSDTQVQLQRKPTLDVSSSLQPSATSDMYQKGNLSSMVPNMRTNMTMPQQLLPSQTLNAADLFKNQFQLNNIPDTSASVQHKQESRDSVQERDAVLSQNLPGREEPMSGRQADATQKTPIMLQEKETLASIPSDASILNSATTKEDIQAFGRSLKPNIHMVDNYSLLHQMQARKEIDPNVLQVKRFKNSDNCPPDDLMVGKSEHPAGLSYPDKNSLPMNNSISSPDANMPPSSIPESSNYQEKHIQQQSANKASQDLLSSQGEPQKSNASAPIAEHSQVSLQMAPTWFKQFGTFKNGQLMPVHDLQRAQLAQNTEQQPMMSKSAKYLAPDHTLGPVNAVVETGQKENIWQNVPQVPNELRPSIIPLASTVTSLRPKKRKRATLDLLPWHKEVASGIQSLPTISSSEEEWAQSARRLIEKVEDEFDVHEDVSPVVRSRRRLVLTTQLMQQILCPPPTSVLSVDATKEFETVAYFTARSALADACSLTCQAETDLCEIQDKDKLPCEEPKANEGIRDQYLKKVMEEFIHRAKSLDNDLPRLDKRVSVLDLRLECQDLERFSVINRFARFHGRGQVDGTEGSSSSDPTAATQRARPQRYVNAYNAPKNLPDRVQCLSL